MFTQTTYKPVTVNPLVGMYFIDTENNRFGNIIAFTPGDLYLIQCEGSNYSTLVQPWELTKWMFFDDRLDMQKMLDSGIVNSMIKTGTDEDDEATGAARLLKHFPPSKCAFCNKDVSAIDCFAISISGNRYCDSKCHGQWIIREAKKTKEQAKDTPSRNTNILHYCIVGHLPNTVCGYIATESGEGYAYQTRNITCPKCLEWINQNQEEVKKHE